MLISKKRVTALSLLVLSGQAFAHAHHSHGPALSQMEQKAAEGIFDDKDVKDRPLSDWDGIWESVYPLLEQGKLDPVFAQKAQKDGHKTPEQVKAYYRKGYATEIERLGIEDGVIEFHRGDSVASCRYSYAGHKILTYASGKKAFATCLNAAMQTVKRLNMCSSAIILSHRANRAIFIFLAEMSLSRRC